MQCKSNAPLFFLPGKRSFNWFSSWLMEARFSNFMFGDRPGRGVIVTVPENGATTSVPPAVPSKTRPFLPSEVAGFIVLCTEERERIYYNQLI